MTEAADSLIPNRLSFQSAGATRRVAVAVLPAVVDAHRDLIEALAVEVPHAVVGYADDRFDILERAEHLKAVLAAVTSYAKAIVKDTAHFSEIVILDETAGLVDTSAEIVGPLLNASDRLQDLQAEADE
jgi:hypothetical protein